MGFKISILILCCFFFGMNINVYSAIDFNETEPSPYRLHMGDRLSVSVYGEPDTIRYATVDSTGHLTFLFLDRVPALGKTIEEVRKHLELELKTYYRYPIVVITPIEFTSNTYSIMGEVNQPGAKPVQGNPTLLTAIALAGGLTTRIFREQTVDQADLALSFLARKGEYIPVNFETLVKDGDMVQDIPLQDGDYIFINTAALRRVYVLGEVSNPLTIEFFDRISLMDAIAHAGGTTIRASSRIAVIRGSLYNPKKYLIDFNRIKKAKACDFPLEPGDIVYVAPQHFYTLKEIIRFGISSFVGTMMSVAGTNAFISIQPAAFGNVIQPVPIVNTNIAGAGTGAIATPVIAPGS